MHGPAVNPLDRDYFYLAKTFDAPTLDLHAFTALMQTAMLPCWRRLQAAGQIASVQMLHKVGDINLQTSSTPVRDWAYFALLELGAGTNLESVLDAELHETADA